MLNSLLVCESELLRQNLNESYSNERPCSDNLAVEYKGDRVFLIFHLFFFTHVFISDLVISGKKAAGKCKQTPSFHSDQIPLYPFTEYNVARWQIDSRPFMSHGIRRRVSPER